MHLRAAVKHGLLILSACFILDVCMKIRSYAEGSYLTNLQELARPKAQH